MNRLKLAVMVALICSFVGAGNALATDTTPADVVNDPAFYDDLNNMIHGTGYNTTYTETSQTSLFDAANYSGTPTVTQSKAASAVSALENAAGVQEGAGIRTIGMGLAGRTFLVGSAFLFGVQVGGSIDHTFGISKWFGDTSTVVGSNYEDLSFVNMDCDSASGTYGQAINPDLRVNSGAGTGFDARGLTFLCTDAEALGAPANSKALWFGFAKRVSGWYWDSNSYCDSSCVSSGTSQDAKLRSYFLAYASANPGVHTYTLSNATLIWMTRTEVNNTQHRTTPLIACSGSCGTTIMNTTNPPGDVSSCTYSSSCGVAVRSAVNANLYLQGWVCHQADPTVCPNDPITDPSVPPPGYFTIPAPNPNETYTDYIARLTAAGWVGTATEVDETSPVAGYGPSSPTQVQYDDGTRTVVLDPANWPATSPTVLETQDITVRVNTTDAVPVPTDSGSPNPDIPSASIDWTPLQDLTTGTHFPFGAIDYVTSVLGWFNVTPVCPGFNIDVPGVTGDHSIASPGSYAGNLCWANTYMGWIRTMISVALWIGAVWLVATKFLHWNWGGDLSGAADDGAVF